jgi:hypothetical protein
MSPQIHRNRKLNGEVREASVVVLMKEIYTNESLKEDLDFALSEHQKITAIKVLREVCGRKHKSKFNLRNYKDTIDKYHKRVQISDKISLLLSRIEKWGKKNGLQRVSKVDLKDKTGKYIYKYSDRDMVVDTLVRLNKDSRWFPSKKRFERYNKLWKQYV